MATKAAKNQLAKKALPAQAKKVAPAQAAKKVVPVQAAKAAPARAVKAAPAQAVEAAPNRKVISKRVASLATKASKKQADRPLRGDEPNDETAQIDSSLLQDVGGFVDDPEKWFRTSNVEFEGRRPVDLLGTSDEPRLRNRIEAAKLGLFS
jgi:uncharacterized protein (DUF2384 family)